MMRATRILALTALTATQQDTAPAKLSPETGYDLVRTLMSARGKERNLAARRLLDAADPSFVPPLVDSLFFTPVPDRALQLEVLRGLTGEAPGQDYYAWVELVGRRTDLAPPTGYLEWKLELLSRIDPTYRKILYPGAPSRIRLEEVVWGGVRLDEIPPLEQPPRRTASEAGFLRDRELVFGVSLGDEDHAYPVRYLSWHEMVNDVVGGEPITLSY